MCNNKVVKSKRLDTLEVTVPKPNKNPLNSSSVLYSNRQRSKAITKAINGKLLFLGSPRHKDYQKAFYCNQYLYQNGKKVFSQYCRKRSCVVCSRILAAKLMSGYVNPLMSLKDLYLVTLTAPNVKRDELNLEVKRFADNWRLIYKAIKKLKIEFRGFKKIEITYNSKRDDFNPHIHVLVSGRTAAEQVRIEHLKRNPHADIRANHIVKVRDKGALIEVFKYVTKAIVKDDLDSRSVDAMYQAIHGKQVYSAFGIKKEKEIKDSEFECTEITHREERVDVWKWCQDRKDWYTIQGESFNDNKIDKDGLRIINVIDKSENHVYPKEKEFEYDGPPISEIIERSRNRNEILF